MRFRYGFLQRTKEDYEIVIFYLLIFKIGNLVITYFGGVC